MRSTCDSAERSVMTGFCGIRRLERPAPQGQPYRVAAGSGRRANRFAGGDRLNPRRMASTNVCVLCETGDVFGPAARGIPRAVVPLKQVQHESVSRDPRSDDDAAPTRR
jgi:hypothetical protein